jgi:hypothetical protein
MKTKQTKGTMSKKVDFRNIVIRDINGQETKADVTALFGNMLYMQGQNIEECELGQAIYHQGDEGPEALELNDKQVAIVKTYADRLPYVMRTGIKEAVQ